MRVFYMHSTTPKKRTRAGARARHWVVSDDPEFVPRGPFRRRRRARKVLAGLRHTETYLAKRQDAKAIAGQR